MTGVCKGRGRVSAPARPLTKSVIAGKRFTSCAVITRCLKLTSFIRIGSPLEGCIFVRRVMSGLLKSRQVPPLSYQTNRLFDNGKCVRCLTGKLPAWFVHPVCDPCLDWEISWLYQINSSVVA